ncbi:heme-binding domain-containing protein [Candidatus Nitrospira salsa]
MASAKDKKLKEIAEKVDEGEMPPWFYLPLHPMARLSSNDRQQLREWATKSLHVTHNNKDE